MNCHEAREGFSALGMGLTEWALVHAHVMQCGECQKERESLQRVVSSRQRVTPSRALLHCLSKVVDAIPFEPTRLTRLRVLLVISLSVSGQAAVSLIGSARVGVRRVLDLLTRVLGLRSVLVKRSERAAANVIGAARFGITRFAHLLTRLRVLRSIPFTVSVRAAGRVIAARLVEAMRVLDLLTRVRRLPPLLFRRSGRAAVRAIGATWSVGRIVVTTAGGAVSLLGARTSLTSGTRPLLKVCAGIASLAVLVAAILALWPRQWPANLMARFSVGERFSRDVRPPVDRKPAELAVAAPLVKTSTPKAVSAPTQTDIPASLRRPDPSLAQRRATASAPMPSTEAAQNAEASDSTAAIDWLLNGGSSRRRIENP